MAHDHNHELEQLKLPLEQFKTAPVPHEYNKVKSAHEQIKTKFCEQIMNCSKVADNDRFSDHPLEAIAYMNAVNTVFKLNRLPDYYSPKDVEKYRDMAAVFDQMEATKLRRKYRKHTALLLLFWVLGGLITFALLIFG